MSASVRLRELADTATPGPWEAWGDHTGRWIIDAESEVVGDTVVARSARLIALAPELARWAADAAEHMETQIGRAGPDLFPVSRALLARLADIVGAEA